jgi:hypothetical protein
MLDYILKNTKENRELYNSELYRFAESYKHGKFPGYKYRAILKKEIETLERYGNHCEEWNLIKVSNHFNAQKVRNCQFIGEVFLPEFKGSVVSPEGLSLQNELSNSTVAWSMLENCHIHDVSMMSRVYVGEGALIRNVGSLVCTGRTHFGIGRDYSIGSEIGGRVIPVYPHINLEKVVKVLTQINNPKMIEDYKQEVYEFRDNISLPISVVGKGAVVINCLSVRNSWVGAHSALDGAIKVHNCTVLSDLEQFTSVREGVIVENSILQWGSKIRGSAIVSDSLIMEVSSARKHAKIKYGIIAPNTDIYEGEVTSSLVGPYVGFHHQSMLIGAIWPDGMGNVSHGASVGSNHNGKLPDQEIFIGRGIFFGLNVSLKFPSYLEQSPWSLFTAGLVLPPGRIDFPFSLISEDSKGRANIQPGWMLKYGVFNLTRSEHKYKARNRSKRNEFNVKIFDNQTAKWVLQAINVLKNVNIKDEYFEKEINGIGACVLKESSRQKALGFYKIFAERFLLDNLMSVLEKSPDLLKNNIETSKLLSGDLLKSFSKDVDLPKTSMLIPKRYRRFELKWRDQARSDFSRDVEKGEKVFPDYSFSHPDNDEKLGFINQEYGKALDRCKTLMKLIEV